MTKREYKRFAYGSTAYAFRLSHRTEDVYRQQLDTLIKAKQQADNALSFSQALREVMKCFIDNDLGYSLASLPNEAGVDVEGLKQSILYELKGWLTDQFATPEKAANLAKVSQRAADGEAIGVDVLDNILEDFRR